MILEIKKYPDPFLKKRAELVKEVGDKERELIKNMLQTLYAVKGVGLAAPQVGVLKRIIVVDVGKGPQVFINPEILEKKGGKEISEEGCLSVPKVFLKIKRWKEIKVKAQDENGKEFEIRATGLLSHCLQQEIDHLNGISVLDRLSFWQKLWRKIKKSI